MGNKKKDTFLYKIWSIQRSKYMQFKNGGYYIHNVEIYGTNPNVH